MKLNCWEFNGCGCQPGGFNELEKGVCPAAVNSELHGVHGGRKVGRACWVVSNTVGDKCEFMKKYRSCRQCGFYHFVRNEEASNFVYSGTLLNILLKNR